MALERLGGNYDNIRSIGQKAKEDLTWWNNNYYDLGCHIKHDNFVLEIFSDASLSGWGTVCNGKSAKGSWSIEEKKNHINYLELLVAYFALWCFILLYVRRQCEILLRIDDTIKFKYLKVENISWLRYPFAWNIDAFTIEWREFF